MRTSVPFGPAVVCALAAALAFTMRADAQSRPAATARTSAPVVVAAPTVDPLRPSTQSQMSIYGSARSASNVPIAKAPIRLRDARTGRIVAQTMSNEKGEFFFQVNQPGIYVPELLDDKAQVLAAGDMLTVDFGQTIATLIRLPMRVPVLGWFGDAAGAIASAAVSAGVLAVAASAPPATPGQ